MKIYPYKQGSKSARLLADALGCKILRREGNPIQLGGQVVINWGSSKTTRDLVNAITINWPEAVAIAANKLRTFSILAARGVSIPPWTEDIEKAKQAIQAGLIVFCRTKLAGHSGQGIVIAKTADELVDAPLYTVYQKPVQEYRIHVGLFNKEDEYRVIFVQRKARKKDVPDDKVNWKIRNHANGFIFAHKDVEVAQEGRKQAIKAVKCLGLHFGAVDILELPDGSFSVLEVNTACGIEGTTLEKYTELFRSYEV